MQQRRRRERKRAALLGLSIAGASLVLILIASAVGGGDADRETPRAAPSPSEKADGPDTLLLLGTRTNDTDVARVVWLALIGSDRTASAGGLIFIPAHTAVEVPGRGLQGLDDAWRTGGVPLVLVSLENLLGIQIDNYLELSDNDALVTFEGVAPLSVDVPNEVRVSAGRDLARLILTSGRQSLDAGFLVDLLYTVGVDANDLDLGARHIAFWESLLEGSEEKPAALGRAVASAEGALAASDATPRQIGDALAALAGLDRADRSVRILPVTPLEVPGDRLYATEESEIRTFVADTLGEVTAPEDAIRVQILNGNGVPGIGQEVADLLVGQGFKVILSGNASRLNHKATKIVTYDSSPEGQALARRARELLKVGQVQVSLQDQGIVDLTIVIGKDFLRVR